MNPGRPIGFLQNSDRIDQAELNRQVDRYRLVEPVYALFAELLKELLGHAVGELDINGIVQARPKGLANFANKVLRKRYRDAVEQITDLCGARVIVEHPDGLAPVCDYIRREFLVDEANSEDVLGRLGESQFGYRSVHLVVALRRDLFAPDSGLGLERALDLASKRLAAERPELEGHLESLKERLFEVRDDGELKVPGRIGPKHKAEIQVRTLLEHAWAANTHDLLYKPEFQVPRHLKRGTNRLAAQLEEADAGFARISHELSLFRTYHGPYRTRDRRLLEISRLKAVLRHEPSRASQLRLATAIGRLAISVQEWEEAEEVLREFVEEWEGSRPGRAILKLVRQSDPPADPYERECRETNRRANAQRKLAPALLDYGRALCQRGDRRGREYFRCSMLLDPGFVDAPVALGDALLEEGDLRQALRCYAEAFRIRPSDPGVLHKYLHTHLILHRSLDFTAVLSAALESAIAVCRDRARVQIYLPHAQFDMGFFHLLLGNPIASLNAYARGVALCDSLKPIERAFQRLNQIRDAGVQSLDPGIEWGQKLLALALAIKARQILDWHQRRIDDRVGQTRQEDALAAGLRQCQVANERLANLKLHALDVNPGARIVVVAGGTLQSEQTRIDLYRPILTEAFAGFRGVVFGGGTQAGISGLVGDLPLDREMAIRIAYLPRIPPWARAHENYQIIDTGGSQFSPMEPLQSWIDLLAAGVEPDQVRVLGVNGGNIAGFEFRLALALGAKVGVFRESGRAATGLFSDEDWADAPGLIALPTDRFTVRSFIQRVPDPVRVLGPELREQTARKRHEEHVAARELELRTEDASLRPWDDLDDGYRRSNLEQVDHLSVKLEAVGMTIRPIHRPDRKIVVLTPAQVELLAEMEHGRWNAERLLDGWQWAEQTDKPRKLHSLLVPWSLLSEADRDHDRQPVIRLIEQLQQEGYELYPLDPQRCQYVTAHDHPGKYHLLPKPDTASPQ